MDDLTVDPLETANLNQCLVAGIVAPQMSADKGLVRFSVGYTKRWPAGGSSTVDIPCVARAQPWHKPGVVVVVKGELQRRQSRGSPTHDGACEVYAFTVQQL